MTITLLLLPEFSPLFQNRVGTNVQESPSEFRRLLAEAAPMAGRVFRTTTKRLSAESVAWLDFELLAICSRWRRAGDDVRYTIEIGEYIVKFYLSLDADLGGEVAVYVWPSPARRPQPRRVIRQSSEFSGHVLVM